MNGAPEPTRYGLTDECFEIGASSRFLQRLIKDKEHMPPELYQDIPWDFEDLSRCLILMLRHVEGDRKQMKELALNLSNVDGLSPYWKALLSRWGYLTDKVIYSNRLPIDVINCMLMLLMMSTINSPSIWSSKYKGFKALLYIKRDTSKYTSECLEMAEKEIEEQWLNHNESNEESDDSDDLDNEEYDDDVNLSITI